MIGEFFIAFFGSLFYTGKYVSSKAANSYYRSETQRQIEERRAKINRLKNPKIESEVTELIIHDYESAYNKYKDLTKGLGLNYPYDDWVFDWSGQKKSGIKMFLLANKGVVYSSLADFGLRCVTRWDDTDVADNYWKKFWKMLKRFDKILQSHGVEPMVVAIDEGTYPKEKNIVGLVSEWEPHTTRPLIATWRSCTTNFH